MSHLGSSVRAKWDVDPAKEVQMTNDSVHRTLYLTGDVVVAAIYYLYDIEISTYL